MNCLTVVAGFLLEVDCR